MSGATLLNLGCGLRRHPAWTNADLCPESPEVLKVDVRQPLPFADREFDAVYAAHMLEHLEPAAGRRLVREMHRVLKPGGVIRLVVPDLEGICRAYLRELEAAARGEPGAADRHAWMVLELVDQMARWRKGGLMLRWWQREPMPAEQFIESRLGLEATASIAHFRRRRAETGRAPLNDLDWDELPEGSDEERLKFTSSGESHRAMYDRVALAALLRASGFEAIAAPTAQESRIPNWTEYALDARSDGRAHKADSLYMEALRPR